MYQSKSIVETPQVKTCSRCKTVKARSEFNRQRRVPDGLQNQCRACQAGYYAANRKTRLMYAVKYHAANPHKGKAWRVTNPDKVKAQHAVNHAIRAGRLTRQPCEECGKANAEAHHDSYHPKHWFNVRWLCKTHHLRHHAKQNRKLKKLLKKE